MAKREEVRLFGETLWISERNASDVLTWVELSGQIDPNSLVDTITMAAACIEMALASNIKEPPERPPFWRFYKLRAYYAERRAVLAFNEKLTMAFIQDNMPTSDIFELSNKVLKMEGFDMPEDGQADSKKKPTTSSTEP